MATKKKITDYVDQILQKKEKTKFGVQPAPIAPTSSGKQIKAPINTSAKTLVAPLKASNQVIRPTTPEQAVKAITGQTNGPVAPISTTRKPAQQQQVSVKPLNDRLKDLEYSVKLKTDAKKARDAVMRPTGNVGLNIGRKELKKEADPLNSMFNKIDIGDYLGSSAYRDETNEEIVRAWHDMAKSVLGKKAGDTMLYSYNEAINGFTSAAKGVSELPQYAKIKWLQATGQTEKAEKISEYLVYKDTRPFLLDKEGYPTIYDPQDELKDYYVYVDSPDKKKKLLVKWSPNMVGDYYVPDDKTSVGYIDGVSSDTQDIIPQKTNNEALYRKLESYQKDNVDEATNIKELTTGRYGEGTFVDYIASGVGQVEAMALTAGLAGNVVSGMGLVGKTAAIAERIVGTGIIALETLTNNYKQRIESGDAVDDAMAYAEGASIIEGAVEMLNGSFGGMWKVAPIKGMTEQAAKKAFLNTFLKYAPGSLGKTIALTTAQQLSEGGEEVITAALQTLWGTLVSNEKESAQQIWDAFVQQKPMDQFLSAFFSTGIARTNINVAQQAAKVDFESGISYELMDSLKEQAKENKISFADAFIQAEDALATERAYGVSGASGGINVNRKVGQSVEEANNQPLQFKQTGDVFVDGTLAEASRTLTNSQDDRDIALVMAMSAKDSNVAVILSTPERAIELGLSPKMVNVNGTSVKGFESSAKGVVYVNANERGALLSIAAHEISHIYDETNAFQTKVKPLLFDWYSKNDPATLKAVRVEKSRQYTKIANALVKAGKLDESQVKSYVENEIAVELLGKIANKSNFYTELQTVDGTKFDNVLKLIDHKIRVFNASRIKNKEVAKLQKFYEDLRFAMQSAKNEQIKAKNNEIKGKLNKGNKKEVGKYSLGKNKLIPKGRTLKAETDEEYLKMRYDLFNAKSKSATTYEKRENYLKSKISITRNLAENMLTEIQVMKPNAQAEQKTRAEGLLADAAESERLIALMINDAWAIEVSGAQDVNPELRSYLNKFQLGKYLKMKNVENEIDQALLGNTDAETQYSLAGTIRVDYESFYSDLRKVTRMPNISMLRLIDHLDELDGYLSDVQNPVALLSAQESIKNAKLSYVLAKPQLDAMLMQEPSLATENLLASVENAKKEISKYGNRKKALSLIREDNWEQITGATGKNNASPNHLSIGNLKRLIYEKVFGFDVFEDDITKIAAGSKQENALKLIVFANVLFENAYTFRNGETGDKTHQNNVEAALFSLTGLNLNGNLNENKVYVKISKAINTNELKFLIDAVFPTSENNGSELENAKLKLLNGIDFAIKNIQERDKNKTIEKQTEAANKTFERRIAAQLSQTEINIKNKEVLENRDKVLSVVEEMLNKGAYRDPIIRKSNNILDASFVFRDGTYFSGIYPINWKSDMLGPTPKESRPVYYNESVKLIGAAHDKFGQFVELDHTEKRGWIRHPNLLHFAGVFDSDFQIMYGYGFELDNFPYTAGLLRINAKLGFAQTDGLITDAQISAIENAFTAYHELTDKYIKSNKSIANNDRRDVFTIEIDTAFIDEGKSFSDVYYIQYVEQIGPLFRNYRRWFNSGLTISKQAITEAKDNYDAQAVMRRFRDQKRDDNEYTPAEKLELGLKYSISSEDIPNEIKILNKNLYDTLVELASDRDEIWEDIMQNLDVDIDDIFEITPNLQKTIEFLQETSPMGTWSDEAEEAVTDYHRIVNQFKSLIAQWEDAQDGTAEILKNDVIDEQYEEIDDQGEPQSALAVFFEENRELYDEAIYFLNEFYANDFTVEHPTEYSPEEIKDAMLSVYKLNLTERDYKEALNEQVQQEIEVINTADDVSYQAGYNKPWENTNRYPSSFIAHPQEINEYEYLMFAKKVQEVMKDFFYAKADIIEYEDTTGGLDEFWSGQRKLKIDIVAKQPLYIIDLKIGEMQNNGAYQYAVVMSDVGGEFVGREPIEGKETFTVKGLASTEFLSIQNPTPLKAELLRDFSSAYSNMHKRDVPAVITTEAGTPVQAGQTNQSLLSTVYGETYEGLNAPEENNDVAPFVVPATFTFNSLTGQFNEQVAPAPVKRASRGNANSRHVISLVKKEIKKYQLLNGEDILITGSEAGEAGNVLLVNTNAGVIEIPTRTATDTLIKSFIVSALRENEQVIKRTIAQNRRNAEVARENNEPAPRANRNRVIIRAAATDPTEEQIAAVVAAAGINKPWENSNMNRNRYVQVFNVAVDAFRQSQAENVITVSVFNGNYRINVKNNATDEVVAYNFDKDITLMLPSELDSAIAAQRAKMASARTAGGTRERVAPIAQEAVAQEPIENLTNAARRRPNETKEQSMARAFNVALEWIKQEMGEGRHWIGSGMTKKQYVKTFITLKALLMNMVDQNGEKLKMKEILFREQSDGFGFRTPRLLTILTRNIDEDINIELDHQDISVSRDKIKQAFIDAGFRAGTQSEAQSQRPQEQRPQAKRQTRQNPVARTAPTAASEQQAADDTWKTTFKEHASYIKKAANKYVVGDGEKIVINKIEETTEATLLVSTNAGEFEVGYYAGNGSGDEISLVYNEAMEYFRDLYDNTQYTITPKTTYQRRQAQAEMTGTTRTPRPRAPRIPRTDMLDVEPELIDAVTAAPSNIPEQTTAPKTVRLEPVAPEQGEPDTIIEIPSDPTPRRTRAARRPAQDIAPVSQQPTARKAQESTVMESIKAFEAELDAILEGKEADVAPVKKQNKSGFKKGEYKRSTIGKHGMRKRRRLTERGIAVMGGKYFPRTSFDSVFRKKERTINRKEVNAKFDEIADKHIKNLNKWKDKKGFAPGARYMINTFVRNINDVVNDDATAEAIIDDYFVGITEASAKIRRAKMNYLQPILDLKMNKNEYEYGFLWHSVEYSGKAKIYFKGKWVEVTVDVLNDYLKEHKDKINIKKVEQAVQMSIAIYDELFDRVNAVRHKFGLDPIPYLQGYFPHYVDGSNDTFFEKILSGMGFAKIKDELPTEIAGRTKDFVPSTRWASFAERRTGASTAFNMGVAMDRYVQVALEEIYLTESIIKLRRLNEQIRHWGDTDAIKKKIKEIEDNPNIANDQKPTLKALARGGIIGNSAMSNFVVWLDDYTDILAGKKANIDRGMEQTFGRQVYGQAKNFMSKLARNMYVGSVGSIIMQSAPLANLFGTVKAANIFNALSDIYASTLEDDNLVAESTFLTNRWDEDKLLYEDLVDSLMRKGLLPAKAMDRFVSNLIYRSFMREAMDEKGMDKHEAMLYADKKALDSMQGRSHGEMPTLYAIQNPIIKTATVFTPEVLNDWMVMAKDLRRYYGGDKKRFLEAMVMLLIARKIMNFILEKITGRDGVLGDPIGVAVKAYDVITNENITPYQKISQFGERVAQEIPIVGGFFNGGKFPISAALPNFKTVLRSTLALGGENGKAAAASIAKELSQPIFYIVPPFGGGQLKKILQGAEMYTHEIPGVYTTDGDLMWKAETTPWGIAQGVLMGKYSPPDAKEYFNELQGPISKQTLDGLVQNGIDVKTYRDVKNEMDKASEVYTKLSKEEKLDYSGPSILEIKLEYLLGRKDLNYDQMSFIANTLGDRKNIIDMKVYDTMESIEEYDYASSNEAHYNVIRAIGTYDEYQRYKDEIKTITSNYVESDTTKKINEVVTYAQRLPLNGYQKALLVKDAYSSYHKSDDYILTYIAAQDKLSESERSSMAQSVGFKMEEYTLKRQNPVEYKVISAIAPYSNYVKYTETIGKKLNENYGVNTMVKYVNTLDSLSYYQKAMFVKKYFPSYTAGDQYILNYINSMSSQTNQQKKDIAKAIGMTENDWREYGW